MTTAAPYRRRPSPSQKMEMIYQRDRRRELDEAVKDQILQLIDKQRARVPVRIEHQWDREVPVLHIRSSLISWMVDFRGSEIQVYGRASWAGRFFDTAANRRKLIDVLDHVAEQLEL